jgi:hypothetical protein
MSALSDEIRLRLAAPFAETEVKWKPQSVSGQRSMVIAYVTARAVMDRLDDVLGPENWQDDYDVLPDGAVLCRLAIRLPGTTEWITKVDVGGESGQPDEHDRRKASFSDALKRTAVKFGIGRYLYRLPHQWVDYDPQKKQLKRTPTLPDWARPVAPRATPASANPTVAEPPAPAAEKPRPGKRPDPVTGEQLVRWLAEADQRAEASKRFHTGELSRMVREEMKQADKDLPEKMENWSPALVKVAVGIARALWTDRQGLGEIDQLHQLVQVELTRIESTWEEFLERHGGDVTGWTVKQWEAALKHLRTLLPPADGE